MSVSGSGSPSVPETPMTKALGDLSTGISALVDNVGQIEVMLKPILAPDIGAESEKNPVAIPVSSTPLIGSLELVTGKLSEVNKHLRDLMSRMQI